jgi:CII-binding regulator of phage lambda lysogenization HflD
MRVTTPAMKLDLRLDTLEVQADRLKLTGVAGILPCEATLTAPEVRALLKLALRPAVLWWLLRGRDVART